MSPSANAAAIDRSTGTHNNITKTVERSVRDHQSRYGSPLKVATYCRVCQSSVGIDVTSDPSLTRCRPWRKRRLDLGRAYWANSRPIDYDALRQLRRYEQDAKCKLLTEITRPNTHQTLAKNYESRDRPFPCYRASATRKSKSRKRHHPVASRHSIHDISQGYDET